MLVTYIRSSSYNNYDYCQQQYFISYVLGHPTTSGKKAQMGTIVHKVMECLAACKKKLQSSPNSNLMSIKDDAIGTVNFTRSILDSSKFVDDLVDKSFEHYTSNCTHSYTKKEKNVRIQEKKQKLRKLPKRKISPLNKLQKIMRMCIKADLPNFLKKNWVNIMRS